MRALKPYEGGNGPLWTLYSSRNTNEHRVSLEVGASLSNFYIESMETVGGYVPFPPIWDVKKGEMIFGVSGPEAKFEYNVQLSFHIAFNEPPALAGAPALTALHYLIGMVESIVGGIEAECRRLGFVT